MFGSCLAAGYRLPPTKLKCALLAASSLQLARSTSLRNALQPAAPRWQQRRHWAGLMAPSSFSLFSSSAPPPSNNAFDSMRARVGQVITPATQNAQAMQGTVLPERNPLCPNMSFKDRVRGCIGCMCIGMALSLMGFFAWWGECTPRARA